jgi:hypothetical protein
MGGIQNCSSKVLVLKIETRVKSCVFSINHIFFMFECIFFKNGPIYGTKLSILKEANVSTQDAHLCKWYKVTETLCVCVCVCVSL